MRQTGPAAEERRGGGGEMIGEGQDIATGTVPLSPPGPLQPASSSIS